MKRASSGLPLPSRRAGDQDQQVSERNWRGIANSRLVLAADHCHDANAPRLLVSMARKSHGMDTLLTRAPDQLRQIDPTGVQPCRLAGHMAVMALLDVAGPAAKSVSLHPSTSAQRSIQAEMLP